MPNSSLPKFPRCLARGPKIFKMIPLAQSVHRLPETIVLKGHHFAHLCKLGERLSFPTIVITLYEVKTFWRKYKKATIDKPTIAPRFLSEARHL